MSWDPLRAALALGVLGFSAFGAGQWIEKLLPATFSRLDRFACCWLGGFGTLGTVLFLGGQVSFGPLVISLVLATGTAAGAVSLWKGRRQPARPESATRFPLLPAIVVAAILLLSGFAGLADVTGDWGSDGVAYHLLGPKVWLREGLIRPVLDNSHTAFPSTSEVLYGTLMWLGGPHGPGLFALLSLSAFLLVTGSLSLRLGLDDRSAWWAAAFLAAMPAAYAGAHSGFVDMLYAGFVLAAARIGFDARGTKEFAAFGLFCGFAIATKYTGVLALVALIPAAAYAWTEAHEDRRSIARGCLLAVAVALLAGSPAYLRNWVLLGCPVYPPPPLLDRVFHAKYLSPEVIRQFHAYIHQRGAGLGRGPGAFLLLPFNLTYHTANFHGAGGIGLYALALGPAGLVASRKDDFAKALALLGLLLTVSWFVTQQESRFLIHVYAIGTVFAVLGWRYVRSTGSRYSAALCGIVIAMSLAYGLFMIGKARAEEIASVFSAAAAERRRQQGIPFYESFRYLNGEPSVQRVLILDRSVPPYYCDKDYVKPIGQWGEEVLPEIRSAQEALAHLHGLRVTHVLDVNSAIAGFQVGPGTPGLALVFARANERIYQLAPGQ